MPLDGFVVEVRNLPAALATSAIEELLRHVGATDIRVLTSRGKKKAALAAFPNDSIGNAAVARLSKMRLADHQLQARVHGGDLDAPPPTAAPPIFPPLPPEQTPSTPSTARQPTPIAPHLGLHYPPSPLLAYKYPKATPEIVANVANALMALPKLYTQVLHLMNKMHLPPPFEKDVIRGPFSTDGLAARGKRLHEDAFQASDDDDDEDDDGEDDDKASSEATDMVPPADVSTCADHPPAVPSQRPRGAKPQKKALRVAAAFLDDAPAPRLVARPGVISEAELNRTRLAPDALAELKYMKGYARGDPSRVLYVKNIAKSVDESDLRHVFGAVFPDDASMGLLSIKLFKEGRLKGQAFVEFPDIDLATLALETIHGVCLEEKPLILCYRKASTSDVAAFTEVATHL